MMNPTMSHPRPGTRKLLLGLSLALVGLPILLFVAAVFLLPFVQQPTMDAFIRDSLHHDPATWSGTQWVYLVALFVAAIFGFTFAAIMSGIFSWYERRVAARMQARIGPNRVGAGGFLQWLADAVKLLFKEDLVPAEADAVLFRAAPYFVVAGMCLTFVVLPFGQSVVVADLNVGLFYLLAVTSLTVVGILLSGWSSNSKWSIFGGMRSAAQVVSYEVPSGLAVMTPILMAGTLSMQGIINQQGGWPWQWFLFTNPAAVIAFFILFTAQLAEANRTPFDLPEAESELVAGYFSEYSGFRYALYFMAEWANLWVISGVAVTLFLGGWQIPGVSAQRWAAWRAGSPGLWYLMQVASVTVFAVKTLFLVNVVIWIRWTLPRIRVDQMMNVSWKYLVPGAFVAMLFTLLWEIALARAPFIGTLSGVLLFLVSLYLAFRFVQLTRDNVARVAGDRVDLSNW